jgi:phosphatidate phosphatase LPIN
MQGVQEVIGKIFLWDYTTKIVISDVDGTVTKSDALGHILPRLGLHDWSQPSICKLY